jgi:hypothetical protein
MEFDFSSTVLNIFFIAFAIFEVPANICMKKLRPKVSSSDVLFTAIMICLTYYLAMDRINNIFVRCNHNRASRYS